jgi:hypothetical protein
MPRAVPTSVPVTSEAVVPGRAGSSAPAAQGLGDDRHRPEKFGIVVERGVDLRRRWAREAPRRVERVDQPSAQRAPGVGQGAARRVEALLEEVQAWPEDVDLLHRRAPVAVAGEDRLDREAGAKTGGIRPFLRRIDDQRGIV